MATIPSQRRAVAPAGDGGDAAQIEVEVVQDQPPAVGAEKGGAAVAAGAGAAQGGIVGVDPAMMMIVAGSSSIIVAVGRWDTNISSSSTQLLPRRLLRSVGTQDHGQAAVVTFVVLINIGGIHTYAGRLCRQAFVAGRSLCHRHGRIVNAETLILLVNDWTTAAGRGRDDPIVVVTIGAAAPTNSTASALGGLLLVRGGAGMDPPPRRGRG